MVTTTPPLNFQTSRIAETFLDQLAPEIRDPRVRMALAYCEEMIGEPPLGLGQLQEAIGCFRPAGRPCYRTIQRWVKDKGMPWSMDTSSNQRIYFLSRILAWYQRTFPYAHVVEEDEARTRESIMRMALRKPMKHAKTG
jgi:hypothetical protein